MEIAGFVIGVIALLISGFLAWNNYLSRARIRIVCGNPRLEPAPLKLEDGGKVIRFSAILPLHFINNGAREGVISDIILLVKSEQNEWSFQPFLYTKYSIKTEPSFGKKVFDDPHSEPFYPVHLAGKSKLYKPIVFALLKHENFPFGNNPLAPGNYNFEVRALEAGKKEYETKLAFNLDLNEDRVENLSKGHIVIVFLKEVIDKRQQLKP